MRSSPTCFGKEKPIHKASQRKLDGKRYTFRSPRGEEASLLKVPNLQTFQFREGERQRGTLKSEVQLDMTVPNLQTFHFGGGGGGGIVALVTVWGKNLSHSCFRDERTSYHYCSFCFLSLTGSTLPCCPATRCCYGYLLLLSDVGIYLLNLKKNVTHLRKNVKRFLSTRHSCVNARGIPPAA